MKTYFVFVCIFTHVVSLNNIHYNTLFWLRQQIGIFLKRMYPLNTEPLTSLGCLLNAVFHILRQDKAVKIYLYVTVEYILYIFFQSV
jgi:hypothetical protein